MKKVYLHIGIHKTGSSSIQQSLFDAKDKIVEQGFFYFCQDFDGVDRPLPQKWIDLKGFNSPTIKDEVKFNQLLKEVQQDKIIISIEALAWFYTQEAVESVARALKGFDVDVITYIRRQDKQMVSYHQEGSKGKNKPSTAYYGAAICPFDIKNSEYLNYYQRSMVWAEAFGKQNIKVRIFEPEKLVKKDVVADFCNLVGLSGVNSVRVNESLGFEATKVGQLINLSNLNDDNLVKKIRENLSSEGKLLPSKSAAENFYKQFIVSNQKLNNEFEITQGGLFKDDFDDYPEQGNNTWDELTANKAITSIFNGIKEAQKTTESEYVNKLRDEAISLEKEDLTMAYYLMKRAYTLRPHGPVIKRKLTEYKDKLNIVG